MNYLLIGRPNVGKSSIYNILTTSEYNIVHSDAGTTRDWHKGLIPNTASYIYDTPGILVDDNNKNFINSSFEKIIIKKINIFFYVVDYTYGYNEIDNFSISKLRNHNKPIILIVNKFDNTNIAPSVEFTKYGINEILFISCSHRTGINNLKLIIKSSNLNNENNTHCDFSIAIFGKPNVGKSTLLNTIVGYERSLTSPIIGTTSDYVVDIFKYKKKIFKIIDTAGIGKKANIKDKSLYHYSVKKSLKRIAEADVAIIIIDSQEGLDRQDKRIINLITDKAKSIILIFNKIDLIKNKSEFKTEIISEIKLSLHQTKNLKIFFITAYTKNHIMKVLDYIYYSIYEIDYIIPTNKLNKWLKNIVKEKTHPLIDNKKVNFKYIVQIKTKPVTIKIFCNYANKLKNNYKRYLTNNFNYKFKIFNQKNKFIFSSSKNPYI